MVTNYPQLATGSVGKDDVREEPSVVGQFVARAADYLGQTLCAMHGHESVLHFEGNRVLLRCTSCGYDSPGWDVGKARPRQRFDGDARRHTLDAPRLALRKMA